MYPRLCKPLLNQSFFLFGPRGVGKTWLLRRIFADSNRVATVNLLKEELYLELLTRPSTLRQFLSIDGELAEWVVIDEVQRVPALLNEVHDILEDPNYHRKIKFALTGSSARKLKRGGADMLAARALVNDLHSLSLLEVGDDWQLSQALRWGTLPAVVTAESNEQRAEILRSYVSTYVKEEIKEEQIVRKLEPFVRFLEAAAQANGQPVAFSKIGDAALVDQKAVGRYFEILEDTLLGFFLPAFTRSARQRTILSSKFYFFDIGVKNALEKNITSDLRHGTSEWGRAFEHHVVLECLKLNSYHRKDARFSHLRTKDGAELDLIIELPKQKPLCVEIKSSRTVTVKDLAALKAITEAVDGGIPILVYDGEQERNENGVSVLPWKKFLEQVWR